MILKGKGIFVMVTFEKEDKKLVVPKSLGNFNTEGGSGSGITPEEAAEIASAVTEAAIDEYDTEIQVDLEEIRDAVSGNSEDISTLSATTQDIAEQIGNLSGVTADISTLSAATSANTENIASLSAATEAISESLGDYATTADTNELATAVSGITDSLGNYATTAVTNEISTAVSGISESLNNYATTAVTDALSAVTSALTEEVAGKQDELTAGNGIDLSGNTISVKIGEGLGFSGDTLVVSGGTGGEQNYVIVDSLSEITEPYAGLEAYRREYTESVIYTGYTIDASQIDENYAAHIYYDGQNEVAVYHNGDGFHWDWDNYCDGDLRMREDFYYTINGEHTIITLLFNNPNAYVTFEEGVTTATTSTTISVFHKAVTYRYDGTAWEEYQPAKVYYLDTMSQAERAALYTEISQYTEFTFPAGNYRFFMTNIGNDEYQGRFEVFVARFYGGSNVCFSGAMQGRYNSHFLQRGYELDSNGDLYDAFSQNSSFGLGVGSFNFSWIGDVVIDLDNSQVRRGEDVLGSGYKYENFEQRDTIVAMIENGARYVSDNGTLQLPQFKISLISNGDTKTYYKPVLFYEDINEVEIDGEYFSTRFTFIYTKEDGSRFKFSFMTNNNQYGADFQYQALS